MPKIMNLTPQEQQEIQSHILARSKIYYRHTPDEKVITFEGIETTVRDYIQRNLAPEIAEFFFQNLVKSKPANLEK